MTDGLRALEATLRARHAERPEGSYAAALFADGERLQRKVMEEAFEVCLELAREPVDRDRLAEEAADLVFHLLAGLVSAGVAVDDVERVLAGRRR